MERRPKLCSGRIDDVIDAETISRDPAVNGKTPLNTASYENAEAGGAIETRSSLQRSVSERRTNVIRLVVTGCLVIEFFRLALHQEILGPTLPYLRDLANTDYASVTQAISGKAVGGVVGGIIAGTFAEKFKGAWALVILVTQLVSAAWMATLPFAPHVGVYWAAFVTMGLLEGGVNIFGQAVVLRMWQARAAAPLHLLHFGFGCGSIIMPLVVSLFFPRPTHRDMLSRTVARLNGSCVELVNGSLILADAPRPTIDTRSLSAALQTSDGGSSASQAPSNASSIEWWSGGGTAAATDEVLLLFSSTLPSHVEEVSLADSPLRYAFILLTAFGALCALVFVSLLIADRRGRLPMPSESGKKGGDEPPKLSDAVRLSSCLPHSQVKVAVLLGAMVAFGAVVAALDRTFGSFIFVYAQRELCFDDDAAVALNSAFWGVFTGGRVVGFLVAQRLHPRYFFLVEVIGLACSCIALGVFGGGDSPVATWVFSLAAAFFLGPVFPSFLAWANRYIVVTGMAITVVFIGVATGAASCITLVGHYLESHPGAVMYCAAGLAATLLAVAGALQAVGSSLGDRFDSKDNSCDKDKCGGGDGDVGAEEMKSLKANGSH